MKTFKFYNNKKKTCFLDCIKVSRLYTENQSFYERITAKFDKFKAFKVL